MALEDSVIVTKETYGRLYSRECYKHKALDVLESKGLMPLTVESLTRPAGKALLEFATWVYLSGMIHKRSFSPHIFKERPLLDSLVEMHFSQLFDETQITVYEADCNRAGLYLRKDGGIFGRLLNAMGVGKPPSGHGKNTKPDYMNSLPHYFMDVANSSPKYDSRRRELLNLLVRILFKDRLAFNSNSPSTIQYYLQLNARISRRAVREYGCEIIRFLNCTIARTPQQDTFFPEQISISISRNATSRRTLYASKIYLTPEQIGRLASRQAPVLNVDVNYS